MALLTRLFSPRKFIKKDKSTHNTSISSSTEPRLKNCTLDKSDVRVLMYRECDWRGRKLLFDSTSVEKVPIDMTIPMSRPRRDSADMIVEISNGYGYKYTKPHPDTNSLGETIFGSVAMATRGTSIKVHSLKDPARVMFTKVVQAPRSRIRRRQNSDNNNLDDSQGSSMNSLGSRYDSGSFDSKLGSLEATLNDSGFGGGLDSSSALCPTSCACGTYCPLHSRGLLDGSDHVHSSNSLQSGSSLSSLRRRWARSVATTLDFVDATQSPPAGGKRTKLAIAVVVPLSDSNTKEAEQFLLDRLPLVNNILTRLQHSTERAYCRRDVFVQSMFQASLHACRSVTDLLNRARLDKPLWLTLTSEKTAAEVKTELADRLVNDLSHLLATLDTKHTNFFISTLVTAVLTHHLGWVPTVLNNLPAQSPNTFAELLRSHPYNPLWAQLSDLQGALGYPPKIAKTVVVGKSEILVEKLLNILSYFIRCGQVSVASPEWDFHPDQESVLDNLIDGERDKDAIQEFSKASSFVTSASTSTSTLTKSKTVLSMKTFSVNEIDVNNSNSLESGFESCNEFSGESYEDVKKLSEPTFNSCLKLVKNRSCANLMETSFSREIISPLNTEENMKTPCDILTSDLKVVQLLETDSMIKKTESEKQYTSANLLNIANRIKSNSSLIKSESRNNSFIRKNILQADISGTKDKENKVVFVLGDNEELVNVKGQDETDTIKASTSPTELVNHKCKPPIILIDPDGEQCDLSGERYEAETKTNFIAGGVSDKIVIIRSTPMELDGTTETEMLKTFPLHRCISAPEEAVSETEWAKRQRSREAVKLIRRWLSDSAIELSVHRPISEINVIKTDSSEANVMGTTPSSVFRHSNRPIKDSSVEVETNVYELSTTLEFQIPMVAVEDVPEKQSSPPDKFITLPHLSCLEQAPSNSREVDLAASVFGGVSDVWSPELVLQGVTQVSSDWITEARRVLLLEARAGEVEQDLGEAVCILANTDTWEVSVISSHSQVEEGGMRVGMSQLVANMLETLQHLDNLAVPTQLCLGHVETKLQDLCVRSQALAELLLNTDFLDIATVTSTLDLDANDVPLLLSVASTHTPLVTRKYGLSFH